MAAAGRGGWSSEGPFTLSDLTRSLQMTTSRETELPSYHATAGSAHYLSSTGIPPRPSPSHQQHPEWYQQVQHQHQHQHQHHRHLPLGLNSSPPAGIKQEPLGEDEYYEDAPAEHGELGPDSKKRKRNKPTLSCKECVDKKMKCDRGRPHCLSCIRRGTECVYRIKAGATEDIARQSTTRRIYPPRTSRQTQSSSDHDGSPASSNGSKPALFTHQGGTDLLLSHVPYTDIGVSNIFGVGSEYPFSNYWTQNGGVSEVLNFVPNKQQADILVNIFFEAFDPVYPLISRERFYVDYEGFWELDSSKRAQVDADFLALVFMMLAMGTQFLQGPGSAEELQAGAEFYSSACYQSLRLFSYLNRTSVRCLQSMVFMTYFLLNSGRASDGWAFSGTLVRQAYASGINREPILISPKFSKFQCMERRRLWHGIVCQDSFMSMSLKLPPAATHSDVDNAAPMLENDDSFFTDTSLETASEDLSNNESSHSDTGYVQSMYSLALLAQETISTPRSLSLPMASNPRQRGLLLTRFRACYRSFPDAFRAWDEASIVALAQQGNKRLVRQIMFLTGLYWHCMTLIQSEGLEDLTYTLSETGKGASNVDNWIRGTLEAASESMRAFFVIHAVLGGESSVWWAFCHRAFSVSITVADLLKKHDTARSRSDSETNSTSSSKSSNQNRRGISLDPCWERTRADVHRMLDLLKGRAQAGDQSAKTRVEVLSNYLS